VTAKDLDAVAPVVSLNVTVHATVPDQVGYVSTTLGLKVMEVSELTVTLLFQSLPPLSQTVLPLAAPVQLNVTRFTLLKFVPMAESVASYGAALVVIVEGVRLVKVRTADMLTTRGLDHPDTTDVWVAHLARAITAQPSAEATDQVFVTEVVPTGSHPELVPSPKVK